MSTWLVPHAPVWYPSNTPLHRQDVTSNSMVASPHLEVLPVEFRPGAIISFKTPEHADVLTFTIIRPFTPFTKSVALQVRSSQLGSGNFIIKLYDARYRNDRHFLGKQPWSLTAELGAAALDLSTYDGEQVWDPEPEPDDVVGRAQRNVAWESYYHTGTLKSFTQECEAYRRLSKLQGSLIPRFFFSGTFIPSDERGFQIPAIIIEYIPDAIPLESDTLTYPGLLDVNLCAKFLSEFDRIPDHGVIHNDINPNNILFTPASCPNRVVVIDFGQALFRDEEDTDTYWDECITFNCDSRYARRLLEAKGIPLDKMPKDPWQI